MAQAIASDASGAAGQAEFRVAPRAGEQHVSVRLEEALSPGQCAAAPFVSGARVTHSAWGEGVVQSVGDRSLTVLFDAVGYKTLAIATVRERGLLQASRAKDL